MDAIFLARKVVQQKKCARISLGLDSYLIFFTLKRSHSSICFACVPLLPRQTGVAIQKSLAMITQNRTTIAIAHSPIYRRLKPFGLSVISCGQLLSVIR